MPGVRYTSGSTYNLRDGPTWADGDTHDVDESTADRLTDRDDFELADDESDESSATPDVSDDEAVRAERVKEHADDGLCGYYDPESMDSPCGRAAGWGRDHDDGLCSQHVDEVS